MPDHRTRTTTDIHVSADATDLKVGDFTQDAASSFVTLRIGSATVFISDTATVDRLQALLDEARALLAAAEQKAAA